MPRLKSAVPTFLVSDVENTAGWYQRQLGFTASVFPDKPPHVYASLQRDGAEIMLLRQPGYKKEEIVRTGGAWDAYIRMDGVRQFCDEVRSRIALKTELTRQTYGDWEFEVRDPNGYVLVFGGFDGDKER